jgi:hypothetical protein
MRTPEGIAVFCAAALTIALSVSAQDHLLIGKEVAIPRSTWR